ncbi:MAG: right-handed parallel beta-helix repeat-containing protein [Deltaproteobacteria bacterium]|nr:right-handed parallel beta-helix repeat-containing protein [Deltaproteobacteria bacterium]
MAVAALGLPATALADGDEIAVEAGGTYPTLAAALEAATADDCIETIRLPSGTYEGEFDLGSLSVTLVGVPGETVIQGTGSGRVITIGTAGEPTSAGPTLRDLTVQGGSAAAPITGAGGGGCIAAFDVTDLTLDSVTVQDCDAPRGGCILVQGGSASVEGVVAQRCDAVAEDPGDPNNSGRGGAILVSDAHADIHLLRAQDNTARGVGGAVAFEGVGTTGTVVGSWLSDNGALWGGGLGVLDGAVVTMTTSSVTNNAACRGGGGISVYNNSATATVEGSLVADNAVVHLAPECPDTEVHGGGGLWVYDADVTVRHTLVHENRAVAGGGLSISTSATAVVDQVILEGNEATVGNGGGVRSVVNPGDLVAPDLMVRNSLVQGNVSAANGGGLSAGGDPIQMSGLLITDNSATVGGGGVLVRGGGDSVSLYNNIVAANEAGRGAAIAVDGLAEIRNITMVGGTCTATAGPEAGVFQLVPIATTFEVTLYNNVIGGAGGCGYALAQSVSGSSTLLGFPSHSLLAPGALGTVGPEMNFTPQQPWWDQPGDAPVFQVEPPVVVGDYALAVGTDPDRDGVDDGLDLGDDPDGSPTDMGAWGGPGAIAWAPRATNNEDAFGDIDGDGVTVWEGDCNDGREDTGPAMTEVCNCRDDDCDGETDEGCDANGPCLGSTAPGDDDDSVGDDDDSAGDDDDSAGGDWAPAPGCLARCDAVGGGGASVWLLPMMLFAASRRRRGLPKA